MATQILIVASSTDSTITVWDPSTGTQLATYKNNASPCNCLSLLGQHYLIASQQSKGAIHTWTWHKDAVQLRSFAPEPLTVLTASPQGTYIAGGSPSGAIHIWEASSGRLLKSWPVHYKTVTSLVFDDACSVLISSSEDTVVYAWLLSDLLDTFNAITDNMGMMMTNGSGGGGGGMNPLATSSSSSSRRKALYSWTDHTLPVRAVAVGGGKAPCVVSVGDDRRVIIHSLASGQLLLDVSLPCQILSVVIDRWEHAVYAGGVDGTIYTISLLPTTAGPGNSNDAAAVVVPPLSKGLKGHTGPVNCLTVSIDGMHLISGSEDKSVRVWELQSSQCVRIINAPCKGPVSGVIACLRPPSLPSTGGGGNSISSSSSIGSGSGRKGQHGGGGMHGGGVAVPLATLSKYPGAPSGKLKAWEGPPIVLHGIDDRMVDRSGDGGSKGVEGGRKEVVVAGDDGKDGSEVEALRLKVGKLEKNVQELAQMNAKLVNMLDKSD